jgi:SelR domain
VRGLGEWPRPFAVAGVFDPERKNSRDRPYSCNYIASAPYSPIGVRGCDRTEVCIMLTRRFLLLGGAIGAAAAGLPWRNGAIAAAETFEVAHPDEEWRKLLKPDQYAVLRQAGTERPFTSPLLHEERRGVFACAGTTPPRRRNSTAERVGRASGRRSTKRSERPRTSPMAWSEPPCTAADAADISGMSSTTGRSRQAFAIA